MHVLALCRRRGRWWLAPWFAGTMILSGAAEPPASPARWRFETMRPPDLAEALRTRPIAWLVLSPLEWHGEAIAFSADPVVGSAIVERAWKQVGGVLIPTLYIGAETEYKEWEEHGLATYWGMEVISQQRHPGSLYVRPLTVELVLRDYLSALQREGFKLCVVMTGHGAMEHVQVMKEVCARDYGSMQVLLWEGWAAPSELPPTLRLKPVSGASHANVTEASLVGGIDPTLVDRTAFGTAERDRRTGLLPENADAIDFAKGRGIIDHHARRLAGRVEAILAALPP